ncbi:MAG: helicase C-terminal domain-containing protein, partial [Aurantimicrobium sp.]
DEANSPVAAMSHHVFETSGNDAKKDLVYKLASGTGRRILFMRTKHHAKKLAKALTDTGIPAVDLHGNLSQPQRDRNLAAFGEGNVKVLVATDVAARGVHVDNVELVIHVDPPMEHKAYLHRSGRTARAGAEGDVVTICLPTQQKDLASLLKKADIQVQPQKVNANSPEVLELVGEIAPYVKPAPREVKPQGGGGNSTGKNAQRKRALREAGAANGRPQRVTRDGQPARDRSGRPPANENGTRRTGANKPSTNGGTRSYGSAAGGGQRATASASSRPAGAGQRQRSARPQGR